MDRRRAVGTLLALAACVAFAAAAPTTSDQTALDLYEGGPASEGCYYNFQHYGEGDRIMTNEPCLNCTCHNRMLMCYLRVCPFTKPIGQDCTVEKRADQCCPIVTCPDVPVDLLTSTSTTSPAEYGATGVGHLDKYGCEINGKFLPEGAKVPAAPNKPCEHCYCIRNMTTCVMQECTLHVDGCTPIYHKDVCCPVRYSCDHAEDEIPMLDDMTTTVRPTPGFLLTTTTLPSVTQDCVHDDNVYADGASIKTEKACEHCYCMKGDIVCVVQECGTPMENEGKNCTSSPPREGQCCPDTYICEGDNELPTDELTTTVPPRRSFIEGSGYRIEPDEINTEKPTLETEHEGSGQEETSEKSTTEPSDVPLVEGAYNTDEPKVEDEPSTEYSPAAVDVTTSEPDKEENTVPSDMFDETTKPPQRIDDVTTIGAAIDSSQSISPEQESELSPLSTTPSTQSDEVTPSGSLEDKFGVPSTELPLEQSSVVDFTPTTSISEKAEITTLPPLEQDKLEKITTAAVELEEPQSITTATLEDEIPQAVTKTALLEKDEPQSTEATITNAAVDQEELPSLTTIPDEKDGSQTTSSTFQEQETSQATTVSSVDKEEPEATTLGSVDRDVSLTSVTIAEEEQPAATTLASADNKEPQAASTTQSVERDESKTTTAPLTEEQEPSATISASAEEEEPQATTSAFADRDISQTTPALLSEEQEAQATTTASVEKEVTQATSTGSVEKEAAQTTIAPELEEQEAQGTTETLQEEEKTQATLPSVERDSSQTTIASLLDEQEPQVTTVAFVEKEITEDTTRAPIENDVPQTTTTPISEEQEPQVTTLASVEKDGITTAAPLSSEVEPQATTLATVETEEPQATTTTIASIEKDASQTTTKPLLEEQESQVTTLSSVERDDSPTTTAPLSEELEPQVTTLASVESDGTQTTTTPLSEVQEHLPTTLASVDKEESQATTTAVVEKDASETTTTVPIITEEESQATTTAVVEKDVSEITTTVPILREEEPQATTLASLEKDSYQTTTVPLSEEQEPQDTATTSIQKETPEESTTAKIEYEEPPMITTPGIQKEESQPTTDAAPLEEPQATTVETDIAETTSVNPSENEIHIESTPASSPGVIPGEGNCLINGETYVNDSKVPSLNKCESSCKCVSSIVKCDPVICSPPPENMMNCRPVSDDEETCCPIYVCDDGKETLPPQSHSQMAGTDKPTILCDNDECKTQETSQPTTDIPSCSSGDCSPVDDAKDVSDCGSGDCVTPVQPDSSITMPDSNVKPPEVCLDGNCLSPPKTCEGELCSQPKDPLCDKDGGCAVETPTEPLCDGLPCVSDITTTKTVCLGDECDNAAAPVVPSEVCIGDTCQESLPETSPTTEVTGNESCAEGSDCQKTTSQSLPEVECTDDACTKKEVNELGNKFGPGCDGSECIQGQFSPSTESETPATKLPDTGIIRTDAETTITPEKDDVPAGNTSQGSVTESSEIASSPAMETMTKVTEIPTKQEGVTAENNQEQTELPATVQHTPDLVAETTEPTDGLSENEIEQSPEPSITTPAEGYIYAKPTGTTETEVLEEITTISSKTPDTITDISTSPKPYEPAVTDADTNLPVSTEGEQDEAEKSTSVQPPQTPSESETEIPKMDGDSVTATTDKQIQDMTSTTDSMIQDEVFTTQSALPEEPPQSTSDETITKSSDKPRDDFTTESEKQELGATETANIPNEDMDIITSEIPEIYTSGLPAVTASSAPIQPSDMSSIQDDISIEKGESTPSEVFTTPSDNLDQTSPAEEIKKDETVSTTSPSVDTNLTEGSILVTSTNQPEVDISETTLPDDKQETPSSTEPSEIKPESPETEQYFTGTPETDVTGSDNIVTDVPVKDLDHTTEPSLVSMEPHVTSETPSVPPSDDHILQTDAPELAEPQQTEKPSEEPQTESPEKQEQPELMEPEFNDTRRFEGSTATLEPEYIPVPVSSEVPGSPSDKPSTENVLTESIPVTEFSTSAPKEEELPTAQDSEPAIKEPMGTEEPVSEITERSETEIVPSEPTVDQEKEITVSQETSTESQAPTEKPLEESISDITESALEHSETTPYLVELEVHTHKTDDFISPEITESALKPERFTTTAPPTEVETSTDEDKQITSAEIDSSPTTIVSPLPTEMGDLGSKFGKPEDTPSEVPATEISLDTTEVSITATDAGIELSTTLAPAEDSNIPSAPSTEKPQTSPEPSTHGVDLTTTPTRLAEETTQAPIEETTRTETKATEPSFTTSSPDLSKPSTSGDELPLPEEEASQFPPSAGPGGYGEPDYVEEDQSFGPGTCRYGGKVYVSAQQIPRDDPCDFCFCFRSDIICLQQSCPPPIHGCHEEPIQGFCCPRYECPVSMATTMNVTTTTTTTTTTLPPHFLPHAYKGAAQRKGCQIKGQTYKVGEVVRASSGPCLTCTCGGDGQMKCDPKQCTPEPMLRQMIAAAVSSKRRR